MSIGLPEIQELMRRYLEEDREKEAIDVEGASLEEALRSASVQLDCPISRIEYSILQQGSSGIVGLGRKPFRIHASQLAEKKKVEEAFELEALVQDDELQAPDVVSDFNGEAFVRLSGDSALLKVTAPVGRGKKATAKMALDQLRNRGVLSYEEEMVNEIVRSAEGEFIKVATVISNPANDALITYELTDQEMKAFVLLNPPGSGGGDLSKEAIIYFLRNNKVINGLKMDVLQRLEDKPRYKEPVLVAEGDKPKNGQDAHIQYFFETDKNRMHLKESADGRVNFKEMGLIQNVVQGQPLAKKVPAERGIAGKTVIGRVLPAKNGKDVPIPLGKNVRLAEDGVTMLAEINGEVTQLAGKINVETIKTIEGDLDMKVGNQLFLGTIIIKGNVEDGFIVKASGDIEVFGNVGRSEIVAEGEIIMHQGVTGKSSGLIRAGKSVWAKFIENTTVEAGEYVIATDGIVNSTVSANRKIVCQGRRAAIVGGHYRACEEISAKSIGSPVGGAETSLEVGFDPKSKEKLDQLTDKMTKLKKIIDEVEKNIFTLTALKKERKDLPEDKQAVLDDNIHRKEEMSEEMKILTGEMEAVQEYLNNLKTKGRISVSQRIYPGVKICIKDVHDEIKNEQKAVSFYLENMLIRTTKFEEIDDEALRRGPRDADKTD